MIPIPPANIGTQWREPPGAARPVDTVVFATIPEGGWAPLTHLDALPLGGEAAVFEETSPGLYEPAAVGVAVPGADLLQHVRVGSTITPF